MTFLVSVSNTSAAFPETITLYNCSYYTTDRLFSCVVYLLRYGRRAPCTKPQPNSFGIFRDPEEVDIHCYNNLRI